MSYAKLTGSSSIQLPCNEKYPEGKERLFNDNIFFTGIGYTESFGHDMETGAPISRAKYVAMSPAGRVISKTAEYIPAFDAYGDDSNVDSRLVEGSINFTRGRRQEGLKSCKRKALRQMPS
jgi:hypothetical protein